jgi:CDP-glucose 4,6-dehydratase
VLVTGAQGFIGSWLVARLLEQGARVVVPRRDVPRLSRFRLDGLEARCEVVQADLLAYDELVRLVNEHDVRAVFHLAAQAIVGIANRSPHSTFESNVRGTYNLLEACRATGVSGDPVERIVVASSDKAYGATDDLPYREQSSLDARYPYDVSKACADMIARSYAASYELPVAVTRLSNVYGGGDFNFSRIVPDTVRALVEGRRPVIRSDGIPRRDYLYAADAVDAYLAVAASLPERRGRAWNAGPDAPVTVLDLVERLIAVAGADVEPEIRGSGTPSGEIADQHLDSSAIREELGWRAGWELDRGLRATWEWYRDALS